MPNSIQLCQSYSFAVFRGIGDHALGSLNIAEELRTQKNPPRKAVDFFIV